MRPFMALCGIVLCVVAGGAHAAPATGATPLLTHDLPGLAGKEGAMVLVDYPPGGADPVHRHNASVFVYVLQGSVIMQVKGQAAVTLHEGQSFFEGPADVHLVGRNASTIAPARFIAFFVKNKAAPFVVPAP